MRLPEGISWKGNGLHGMIKETTSVAGQVAVMGWLQVLSGLRLS